MNVSTSSPANLITCAGCGAQVPFTGVLLRRWSRPALHRQLHQPPAGVGLRHRATFLTAAATAAPRLIRGDAGASLPTAQIRLCEGPRRSRNWPSSARGPPGLTVSPSRKQESSRPLPPQVPTGLPSLSTADT